MWAFAASSTFDWRVVRWNTILIVRRNIDTTIFGGGLGKCLTMIVVYCLIARHCLSRHPWGWRCSPCWSSGEIICWRRHAGSPSTWSRTDVVTIVTAYWTIVFVWIGKMLLRMMWDDNLSFSNETFYFFFSRRWNTMKLTNVIHLGVMNNVCPRYWYQSNDWLIDEAFFRSTGSIIVSSFCSALLGWKFDLWRVTRREGKRRRGAPSTLKKRQKRTPVDKGQSCHRPIAALSVQRTP